MEAAKERPRITKTAKRMGKRERRAEGISKKRKRGDIVSLRVETERHAVKEKRE